MNFLLRKFQSTTDDAIDENGGGLGPPDLRRRSSSQVPGHVTRQLSRTGSGQNFASRDQMVGTIDIDEMSTMLYDIWHKNLVELPVSKDLPRLARKILIYNDGEEVVNFVDDESIPDVGVIVVPTPSSSGSNLTSLSTGSTPASSAAPSPSSGESSPLETNYMKLIKQNQQEGLVRAVFSILQALATEMGELVSRETGLSIAGMTLELFDREVNIADHESLNGFLLRYFGETGRVTRILKACNQSILAAPVTQLKKALMSFIDYKDAKGGPKPGWEIIIRIQLRERMVMIEHRKIEQVVRKNPETLAFENIYRFEWCLTLGLRLASGGVQTLELDSMNLTLTQVDFESPEACSAPQHLRLSSEEKKLHKKTLENLFQTNEVNFVDAKTLARMQEVRKRKAAAAASLAATGRKNSKDPK